VSFGEGFRGFGEAAFLAFEPRKWASNVYNMERMAVRDQLRALGAALQPALTVGRVFQWDVTPHTPNVFNGKRVSDMTLYFTRTEEQRKAIAPLLDSRIALPDQIQDAGEHHRHVTLGVRLDLERVEVGLLMHSTAWLDVMNVLNRCRAPAEAATFVRLVQSLPAGAVVRVGPDAVVQAASFGLGEVHRLEEAVLNETFVIFAGLRLDSGDGRVQTPGLTALARETLEALLPLWDFVAWRPASNFLAASSVVAPAVAAEAPHAIEIATGTKVRLVDGVFAGREGRVTDIDVKGHVRVLVGKVNVRTDVRAIRAV
jgi:hypothetical protein